MIDLSKFCVFCDRRLRWWQDVWRERLGDSTTRGIHDYCLHRYVFALMLTKRLPPIDEIADDELWTSAEVKP